MIDKNQLTLTVEEALRDTDLFLVDVSVTPDNRITVEFDSPEGVDIDTCVALSRAKSRRRLTARPRIMSWKWGRPG